MKMKKSPDSKGYNYPYLTYTLEVFSGIDLSIFNCFRFFSKLKDL